MSQQAGASGIRTQRDLLFLIEGVIIAWKLLRMTGLLLLCPAVRFVQDHEVWTECVTDRLVGGLVLRSQCIYTDFPGVFSISSEIFTNISLIFSLFNS